MMAKLGQESSLLKHPSICILYSGIDLPVVLIANDAPLIGGWHDGECGQFHMISLRQVMCADARHMPATLVTLLLGICEVHQHYTSIPDCRPDHLAA